MLYPHTDIFNALQKHWNRTSGPASALSGTNQSLIVFLKTCFAGEFPDSFDFGKSTPAAFRTWLADVRIDMTQSLLSHHELTALIAKARLLLKKALEQRQELLVAFREADWKVYYGKHPEEIRRGKEFQAVLLTAIAKHAATTKTAQPLLASDCLSLPPFMIYDEVPLAHALAFRPSSLAHPVAALVRVLRAAQTRSRVPTLEGVKLNANGDVLFSNTAPNADLLSLAKECVTTFFVNTCDPWALPWGTFEKCRDLYMQLTQGMLTDTETVIARLIDIYRLAAKPATIRLASGKTLGFVPVSLDGHTEVLVDEQSMLLEIGPHGASTLDLTCLESLLEIANGVGHISDGKAFLQAVTDIATELLSHTVKLPLQEQMGLINSLMATLMQTQGLPADWPEPLAQVLEDHIAPLTVYLPDTPEGHDVAQANPSATVVFVHPVLFNKTWPGIMPHLRKICWIAQPCIFDNLAHTFALVRASEVPPETVTLIYELFFNHLSKKAFKRNADVSHIVTSFTSIGKRIMPRRTPVLLFDPTDPRVKTFASSRTDVGLSMLNEHGKVRLVVHPQVWREWQQKHPVPHQGIPFEWALSLPTASPRTLYVFGMPTRKGTVEPDMIVKAHSTIWSGPAKRRLTQKNVDHSALISNRVGQIVDGGTLPPRWRHRFAYIDDGNGVAINHPPLYPEKGSVATIHKSPKAYPPAGDPRVLIAALALANNDVTKPDNGAQPILLQLLDLNAANHGKEPLDVFFEEILNYLFQMLLHFLLKDGILLEPHGQNLFVETDLHGRITRLVFKDWQSTMVDEETRIRRGLPAGEVYDHILGVEAGLPLSSSLVIDYYLGTYLLTKILDALVEGYHGTTPTAVYRTWLVAKFKKSFETAISIYQEQAQQLPDVMVRHGKKPKTDRTNRVPYAIAGPPPFRHTSLEKGLMAAIDERRCRGEVRGSACIFNDPSAVVTGNTEAWVKGIDLEQTRLLVQHQNEWSDVRDLLHPGMGCAGACEVILPANYDPNKKYTLVVLLHGQSGNGGEVNSWFDKWQRNDVIGIIPLAPFTDREGSWTWFDNNKPLQKQQSLAYLSQLIAFMKSRLPVDRCILGGLSQGGYMALHALLHQPELCDAFFVVNAPFATKYFDEQSVQQAGIRGKPLLICSLTNDPIVHGVHAQRAQAYFKALGCLVTAQSTPAGQHHKISQTTAQDISLFLDQQAKKPAFPEGKNLENDLAQIEKALQAKNETALTEEQDSNDEDTAVLVAGLLEKIQTHTWPVDSPVLLEALLDTRLPLSLRMASLGVLEQQHNANLANAWIDTSLVTSLRDTGVKLRTILRLMGLVTAQGAYVGKDRVSTLWLKKFHAVLSSMYTCLYLEQQYALEPESPARVTEIKKLAATVTYLYDTVLELRGELLTLLVG